MEHGTYWDGKGQHQNIYLQLEKLIPAMGAVTDPKLKALEKLRRAANCYYDLYNNGLCNRASEFRSVFGFGGMFIVKNGFRDCPKLEAAMDKFILAAGAEQFALQK